MFEGQPKGLWALALANTGERFGYYTMLAVFLLYLQANFGFAPGLASGIYSTFLMLVYFLPVIGGAAADKFGFGKMVTSAISCFLFLSEPTPQPLSPWAQLYCSLASVQVFSRAISR